MNENSVGLDSNGKIDLAKLSMSRPAQYVGIRTNQEEEDSQSKNGNDYNLKKLQSPKEPSH